MSVFLLRSCTLFSASSFFCLIVFFRKEIKKRNALRKSSFLSFLFFPSLLPPPFFVFFFPSHFLLKLLCFFFPLLSFSRSHFSRKLLFGFKCRRGIVSPFDVTSGQAGVRVAARVQWGRWCRQLCRQAPNLI